MSCLYTIEDMFCYLVYNLNTKANMEVRKLQLSLRQPYSIFKWCTLLIGPTLKCLQSVSQKNYVDTPGQDSQTRTSLPFLNF